MLHQHDIHLRLSCHHRRRARPRRCAGRTRDLSQPSGLLADGAAEELLQRSTFVTLVSRPRPSPPLTPHPHFQCWCPQAPAHLPRHMHTSNVGAQSPCQNKPPERNSCPSVTHPPHTTHTPDLAHMNEAEIRGTGHDADTHRHTHTHTETRTHTQRLPGSTATQKPFTPIWARVCLHFLYPLTARLAGHATTPPTTHARQCLWHPPTHLPSDATPVPMMSLPKLPEPPTPLPPSLPRIPCKPSTHHHHLHHHHQHHRGTTPRDDVAAREKNTLERPPAESLAAQPRGGA